jgi:DnaJ-class molecular chaperone
VEVNMKKYKCPVCNGKKEYDTESEFNKEKLVYPVKCSYCDGTGKVDKGATYTGIRKG